MKNWIYCGVFFSKDVKHTLLNLVKEYVNIDKDWKIFCDHMTIVYNDGSEMKNQWAETISKFVGQSQTLKITKIGISDKAIALGVSEYATQNKHSHITIATAPGVKPVESNNITNWYNLSEETYVSGTINIFYK